MPGPRLLGLAFLPWFVAAGFPPAEDFFRRGRAHSDIYSAEAKPSPFDESKPLEARARAYLDLHCSACHRPEGVLRGSLDLRFSTPLARTGLYAPSGRLGPEGLFLPRLRPGDPEASELHRRLRSTGNDAMPPLGRTSRDERGLALIRQWIESLRGDRSSPAAQVDSTPAAMTRPSGGVIAHPTGGTAIPILRGPGGGGAPLVIPRAEGEPGDPPTVRICPAGGPCRPMAAGEVLADAARKVWVARPPAGLPRGRFWLVLSWQGRIGRRDLLVL